MNQTTTPLQLAHTLGALLENSTDALAHDCLQYIEALSALAEHHTDQRDFEFEPRHLYYLLLPIRDRLELIFNDAIGPDAMRVESPS